MKWDVVFPLIFIFLLGFLPGCGRVIDWGKNNFDQGKELNKNISVARDHIKSIRVYDQFTVAGGFDALWLSDDARISYVDLYSLKRGKSSDQRKVFLRRQIEENNHFVSFYVLSLKEIVLGENDSNWTLFLKVGDNFFNPTEIKTVDLSPEYKDIFGKKFSKFKDAYQVSFNAKDVEDNFIVNEGTDQISLVFRSLDKEIELDWSIRSSTKVVTENKK